MDDKPKIETRIKQAFDEGMDFYKQQMQQGMTPQEIHDEAVMRYKANADTVASTSDAVNPPKHYGGDDSPYEAIKVIEAWGLGFLFRECG